MGEPRDISDCRSHEELLALWRVRYERIRASRERALQAGLDPTRLTHPPRDPDERAWLEQHGKLPPYTEKPNPPWAKGWPPRAPWNMPKEGEPLSPGAAATEAWRAWRPESDSSVPPPDTAPTGEPRQPDASADARSPSDDAPAT